MLKLHCIIFHIKDVHSCEAKRNPDICCCIEQIYVGYILYLQTSLLNILACLFLC